MPRALLALLVLVALGWTLAQEPDEPAVPVGQLYGPVQLLRVVDGDTLVLESNIGPRTVRLIGIDAPELGGGQAGSREAADYLTQLMGPGMLVWLELDHGLEDIYGRLLAYVYVPDARGAWLHAGMHVTQVNLRMVEAGWARPMTVEPNVTYEDLIAAAAAAARAEARGLWAEAQPSAAGAGLGAAPADVTTAPAEGAAAGADVTTARAEEATAPTGLLGAAADPVIRLHCGLLNPTTPNDMGEWVSVILAEPHDTRGYYLYDEGSGAVFRLPVGVQPPGEIRIENPGQGVWNNSGDVIYLKRGDEVVDVWAYEGHEARSGVVVCRDR